MRHEPLVSLDDVSFVGRSLDRPESVVCRDGRLAVSNWSGGITLIEADGEQTTLLADRGAWMRPNGIAWHPDGTFAVAHLGDDSGGVYVVQPDGSWYEFLTEVDGEALPPTNFVHLDQSGRWWITISTRRRPRSDAYRRDVSDGFVVCVDRHGARVVADELGYTNEARVDPSGSFLYVNETFSGRLSRFPLMPDGKVGKRQTVVEFAEGVFPDGLAFDSDEGIWIVSIVSNRVLRVDRDRQVRTILDDSDPAHLDAVERSLTSGGLTRDQLNAVTGKRLRNVSSIAFGGTDLQTVYLGCIGGDSIATFRSPIPGIAS